jgi:hypothetical protein
MQKKKKRIPEYSCIYRVVLAPYPTRIRSCTIQVLPVSVSNIKIVESVSEKTNIYTIHIQYRRVYPICFHPYRWLSWSVAATIDPEVYRPRALGSWGKVIACARRALPLLADLRGWPWCGDLLTGNVKTLQHRRPFTDKRNR